jgi:hypothetical protein
MGNTFTATAGENLSQYDLCYKKSDGKFWKAKADSPTTMPAVYMAAAVIAANATGAFYKKGLVQKTGHGLAIGSLIYVSAATAGLLTTTTPSGSGHQVQVMGQVEDVNYLDVNPQLVVIEVS